MPADLRLSSPRASWAAGSPSPHWPADEADAEHRGGGAEGQGDGHRGGGEQDTNADQRPGGGDEGQSSARFGWWDSHIWRAPRPGVALEPPPRWLGVLPKLPACVARPTPRPVEAVPHDYRLGCVLPSGSAVAAVLRAASADEPWVLAAWDGEAVDIEAVLSAADELVPTWFDLPSPWGLSPGPLTPRAVAAGMTELAGWCVTAGVREVLGCGVDGVDG